MSRESREEESAGGIVFRLERGRPRYLLIRDSYRNWGFPKGHLEPGEEPATAAVREVGEETGLGSLLVRGLIDTIDWDFRFRGQAIHKVCHFFLMESRRSRTSPQRAEGITACRWMSFDEAQRRISYRNARDVLRRAHAMVNTRAATAPVRSNGERQRPVAATGTNGPRRGNANG
jgi:8-oxo-dGTP pyrophosphatase MutT (NUDIX family)